MVHLTGKSAPNDPKMTLTCSRSKSTPYANYIKPQSPNYHPFRTPKSSLRATAQFCASNHPKIILPYSRSKIPICILHTHPRCPIFSALCDELYDERFVSNTPFREK